MPTYEIYCPTCGTREEIFDSWANASLYRCPSCQSNTTISPSAPNVHFKASVGEIRRAEVKYTDADGKEHVRRMPELERTVKPTNKFKGARE